MADNIKGIPFRSHDEGKDFPHLAKELTFQQALNLGVLEEHPTFSIDEVYIVQFTYILGNFKALVSTSLPDGRYYEVTYKSGHPKFGVEPKAFVDTYVKTHNNEIYFENEDEN